MRGCDLQAEGLSGEATDYRESADRLDRETSRLSSDRQMQDPRIYVSFSRFGCSRPALLAPCGAGSWPRTHPYPRAARYGSGCLDGAGGVYPVVPRSKLQHLTLRILQFRHSDEDLFAVRFRIQRRLDPLRYAGVDPGPAVVRDVVVCLDPRRLIVRSATPPSGRNGGVTVMTAPASRCLS